MSRRSLPGLAYVGESVGSAGAAPGTTVGCLTNRTNHGRSQIMESGLGPIVGWVLAFLVWLSAPLVALGVSVRYFVRSIGDPSMLRRLATSAHGVVIAVVYVIAITIAVTGAHDPAYGKPFFWALIAPVALIVISFVCYRGSKQTHWLQVPNVLCLGWTGVVGGMAVTGQWL